MLAPHLAGSRGWPPTAWSRRTGGGDGLCEHYGIEDGLTFWEVHERLDVEHAEAERAMLAEVGGDDPESAVEATREALEAWWGFLDAADVV